MADRTIDNRPSKYRRFTAPYRHDPSEEYSEAIQNIRENHVRTIYKQLNNEFCIHEHLDDQEVFDAVWHVAEDIQDNGWRPLTADEKSRIRKARDEAQKAYDKFQDTQSERKPIKEDWLDNLNHNLALFFTFE